MDGPSAGVIIAASAAILNILFTVAGGIFFWGRVVQRLDEHSDARAAMSKKLDEFLRNFQTALLGHVRVETRLEHAEENISRIDNTVEGLRRGDGFIRGRGHGIDKEYG